MGEAIAAFGFITAALLSIWAYRVREIIRRQDELIKAQQTAMEHISSLAAAIGKDYQRLVHNYRQVAGDISQLRQMLRRLDSPERRAMN